jgi:hypothetical protein
MLSNPGRLEAAGFDTSVSLGSGVDIENAEGVGRR